MTLWHAGDGDGSLPCCPNWSVLQLRQCGPDPHAQTGPSSCEEVLLGRVRYWAVTQWRSAALSSVIAFTRSLWAKPTNNSQAFCLPSFSGLFQITHWLFEVGWWTGRVFPCFSAKKRLGHQQLCHPPTYLEWPLNKKRAYLGIWSETHREAMTKGP